MRDDEGPYRSPLLDEIHTHFPALLYDTEQFRSVTHVLNYVNRQMQRRYDIFTNAREEYRREHPRVSRVVPQRPAAQQGPPQGPQPVPATPPLAPTRQNPPLIVRPVTQLDSFIQNLINPGTSFQQQAMNLLAHLDGTGPIATFDIPIVNDRINPTFLEPVPVRPSQAQINAATVLVCTTGQMSQDETCAVCQDGYTEGAETRILNHCRHQFHRRCIDRWFQQHVQCPVCRHDIRTTD